MSDILKEVKGIISMARARSKSGKSKTSTLDKIVEEMESKDKQIQALNEELGDRNHWKSKADERVGRIKEVEKERDTLNERLARMVEVLEFLSEEMPRPMGPDDDDNDWEMVAGRKISNAISSHNPDWMKARIAEAVMDERCTHTCQYGNGHAQMCTSKAYRQPNQSREKMG